MNSEKIVPKETEKNNTEKNKAVKKTDNENGTSQNYKTKAYIIGVAVVLAALMAGFFIPKSDNAAAHGLEILKKFDKAYSLAKRNYDNEIKSTEELRQEIADSQKKLEKSQGTDDPNGKISATIEALRGEAETLRAYVKEKQETLDTINANINEYSNKILTWTSGKYTVGKDVAPGSYNITGTGSIAIGSNNKSKVSKVLKSDGEAFTLSEGDIISIDGSAKLTPQ